MLCPRCSSNQSDDIKFCTFCGANLQAVREAIEAPDSKKFDWSNTWVAEMFMSGQAAEMRKIELERRLGITPEVKRYNEIKAGVICSCVGIGVSVFLFMLMQGIAAHARPEDAEILTRIWVAGLIPFMIGLALIINGVVVSKKMVQVMEQTRRETKMLEDVPGPPGLRPADTNEFIPANMSSVTDQTTRHLENAERKISR
ncbi:MAG TPA: hypothetical protein VHS05_18650 [Pyrinomonadaceae bacterium]|jgi:hypothetical protein|nr:hypothetical protein [Pyrinomonadaceae bacterium]